MVQRSAAASEATLRTFAERSPLYVKWKWQYVCRHKLTSLSLITRLNHLRRGSKSRDHSAWAGRCANAKFLEFHDFFYGLRELKRALALHFVILELASLIGAAVNHLFISFHQAAVRSSPSVWLLAGLELCAWVAAVAPSLLWCWNLRRCQWAGGRC